MPQDEMPYTVKYRPTQLEDVIGHAVIVERLHEWINEWKQGNAQKPILLYGKAGMGKTSLVQALANDYDLELLEMNASDTRTSKAVERIAGNAASAITFSGKMRLILFDEVDGLFLQDKGGSASINAILKSPSCPIILTANDAWSQKLSTIRSQCEIIEVKKVHYSTISKLLQKISVEEGIKADFEALAELAKISEGDVRSAVNDFQFLATSKNRVISLEDVKLISQRDRIESSMFNIIQKVLKTLDFKEAVESTYNLKENPDFVLKWVSENVPKEYKKPADLHNAFEQLSKADIYLGRVYKRQNYGFWRYASVLMTAGVAFSKDSKYHGFTRYSFPSFISYLGRTKGTREAMKGAAEKIAKFCHVSTRTAIQDYIPMFEVVMQDEKIAADFAYKLNFDEDDLGFFGVKYPEKIFEAVNDIKSQSIKAELAKDKSQNSLSHFF